MTSEGVSYPQSLPRARRRAQGAYYTPPELVARVVAETLAPVLPRVVWRDDGSPELKILDPAAGDGRFLLACLDRLVAASPRGPGAREAIVRLCLTAVERDAGAADVARAALGEGADVRVADALGGAVDEGVWDVVIGNPPYLRSVALKQSDPELWRRLRGAYAATSYKEWDLYGAFLEQSLRWAGPAGQIGFVTPSRWLTGAFAARLRELLAGARAVRRIVDLGGRQVFDGATTYVALVFLSRAPADEIRVEREGEGEGSVAASTLGAGPWILAVGDAAARLARLRAAGPPLGSIARIAKGAGSNADPVFLLEPRPDGLWSPALGERVEIEPDAVVPCLRGRDVGAWRASPRRLALIHRDMPFAEVERRWPAAAAYLSRCRALLEAREAGRFTGERFHLWGRPQNLAWLLHRAPKVVVPDAAREGRAALDAEGRLVIDTAYAIRPLGDAAPIGLLLAVLNSALVRCWLAATGIPLRGGYFRMKTAYLGSLPVPDPTTAAARRLAGEALEAAGDPAAGAEIARRAARLAGVPEVEDDA